MPTFTTHMPQLTTLLCERLPATIKLHALHTVHQSINSKLFSQTMPPMREAHLTSPHNAALDDRRTPALVCAGYLHMKRGS